MISTKTAKIKITFSEGNCKSDYEYWNAPEWVVTSVLIVPETQPKLKDFKYDFSGFKKQNTDEEYPKDYDYHNENSGILFKIEDGEIYRIFFYPPKSKVGYLCGNESTLEYFSGEETLVEMVFDDLIIDEDFFANVTELTLSETEIIAGCNNYEEKNRSCSVDKQKVSVKTTAVDPEIDVLTYNYVVSAGKIIGAGANVVWDLSGVKPGVYTITAGVNDGCGVCGETKTEVVTVKECPDCLVK